MYKVQIQLKKEASMAVELHNFIWEGVRLVQVETQPHHIAGVLAEIRNTLENSNCQWEDIYSAYYECEEDGTVTFYEGESAEAGNPGIWTYVVYDATAEEEVVVPNLNINTLAPVLQLKKLLGETEHHTFEEEGETNFEQRLVILENTVAGLKRQFTNIQSSDNWLDKVIGSISDESAFSEALEYGQSFRKNDRTEHEATRWQDRPTHKVVELRRDRVVNEANGQL